VRNYITCTCGGVANTNSMVDAISAGEILGYASYKCLSKLSPKEFLKIDDFTRPGLRHVTLIGLFNALNSCRNPSVSARTACLVAE
jgi:hypothetical protein